MNGLEQAGKELARLVNVRMALADEKKAAMAEFKSRDEQLHKRIKDLSLDISMGQPSLFEQATERG